MQRECIFDDKASRTTADSLLLIVINSEITCKLLSDASNFLKCKFKCEGGLLKFSFNQRPQLLVFNLLHLAAPLHKHSSWVNNNGVQVIFYYSLLLECGKSQVISERVLYGLWWCCFPMTKPNWTLVSDILEDYVVSIIPYIDPVFVLLTMQMHLLTIFVRSTSYRMR